jgi:hypothetical protein
LQTHRQEKAVRTRSVLVNLIAAPAFVALLVLHASQSTGPTAPRSANDATTRSSAQPAAPAGPMHVPFFANTGRYDEHVQFYTHTCAGTVCVTHAGQIVYTLPEPQGNAPADGPALREDFGGQNSDRAAMVQGRGRRPARIRYFGGNDPVEWWHDVFIYDSLDLGERFQGIQVTLTARQHDVAKRFRVKPGAKPERIKVRLSGRPSLQTNARGDLEVQTKRGVVRFARPTAYQDEDGTRKEVAVAYTVDGDEYGFVVGDYDPNRTLIIDPPLTADGMTCQ